MLAKMVWSLFHSFRYYLRKALLYVRYLLHEIIFGHRTRIKSIPKEIRCDP